MSRDRIIITTFIAAWIAAVLGAALWRESLHKPTPPPAALRHTGVEKIAKIPTDTYAPPAFRCTANQYEAGECYPVTEKAPSITYTSVPQPKPAAKAEPAPKPKAKPAPVRQRVKKFMSDAEKKAACTPDALKYCKAAIVQGRSAIIDCLKNNRANLNRICVRAFDDYDAEHAAKQPTTATKAVAVAPSKITYRGHRTLKKHKHKHKKATLAAPDEEYHPGYSSWWIYHGPGPTNSSNAGHAPSSSHAPSGHAPSHAPSHHMLF